MAGNLNLGKLERITELRQIWKNESGHFTPWLAQEENLQLLGDTIGLDLELEATEKDVGPFRADILCKETGLDHWVLIENQIEKTDHTHLGQIMTYAAGLNAVTIVWIAKQFSDEHRAALDWLNEVTIDGISFFGLEIELWQIGQSPIAPKFNIVSKPNEWTKGAGGGAAKVTDLTPAKQLQLEYWTVFREVVAKYAKRVRPTKPQPQHWINFSIGRAYFGMYSFVDTQNPRIGVRMFIEGPDAKAHFHLLELEKEEIEQNFGEPLVWQELPEKKSSYISLYNENENPKQKSRWPQQHEWLLQKLEKFHEVFSQRIKNLDAGDWGEENS